MNDIRLIVCDLDGTLIDKNEVIPESFYQLRNRLADINVPFTIATGRSSYMVQKFILELSIEVPYILNNGGMIKHSNNIIYSKNFRLSPLKSGLMRAMELGMSVMFVYADGRDDTVMRKTNWTEKKYVKFGSYSAEYIPTHEEWETLEMQKITIIDKEFKIQRATDFFCKSDDIKIIFYDNGGVEIMSSGVDKSNAITRLIEILNIDKSNVLSIGNDMNDIGMLKIAGVGACVNNAIDQVKEIADYVCELEHSDGVKEVIEKFIF